MRGWTRRALAGTFAPCAAAGLRQADGASRPKTQMKWFSAIVRALVRKESDEEREFREGLARQRRAQLRRELERGGLWGDLWNLAAVAALFLLVLVVVSAFYLLLFAFEF